MSDALEEQLLASVHSFEPEIVSFCQKLLQTPSVNGIHDEIAIAEAIAAQAQALGLHVVIAGENPRRPNVIISTAPHGPTGLLLIGHLDTVPTGDESLWKYPPFSGAIADGRIYGRGAIDTKGGMASALYALAALAKHDEPQHGRTQLICVPDEESGATGTLGIKFLHAKGLLSGLGAIYAYSGSDITLGHRGLLRFRLICEGEAAHTGFREWQDGEKGANAVTGMARLLLELENIQMPFSTTPYFEQYRTLITPGTMISGGVGAGVVPERCEALVDTRLTPEYDREQVETLLKHAIARITNERPKLRFHYEVLNYIPAPISDENAPIFSILEDVIQQVKAILPQRLVAGPANEGYLLIERGIPTVCGLGPTGDNAHSVDEYTEIQGLVDAAAIFALTARRLSEHLNP
ncbi:MAG: M20/M25/M40 family metallo-hydrolase [Burkholderiales bacterium]|nr:M20/M25/M40 family metallo-hydrolase [Anaerolineae bacterium]